MQFLGIKIDETSNEQALQRVAEFLNSNGQAKIFTPNPEFVVKAQKDEYFKKVLNSGDLNLCDGFGLALAVNLSPSAREGVGGVGADTSATPPAPPLGKRRIERIVGVDFMLEICALALESGSVVYLLGSGNEEVVKQTAENLKKQFPSLKIVGYDKGPIVDELRIVNYELWLDKINSINPDILFVAFGMGKQEKWIYENLAKMPSVKIAMGVGGSFDFISGKVKRAPLFLRRLGLEWMYRLVQEPRRFGRIFNATVKFMYLFLINKK